jgi:DNA-binding transcriptional regulator YiaG
MTADEFRQARRELGLSAAKLAAALELGAQGGRTVRRWEQEPGTKGHRPVAGPAAVAVRLMLAMRARPAGEG